MSRLSKPTETVAAMRSFGARESKASDAGIEGVQLGQAHPCSAFPGEADVGYLWRGEDTMVIEETADRPVPFGEPTDYRQEPSIDVTPAPTSTDCLSGA